MSHDSDEYSSPSRAPTTKLQKQRAPERESQDEIVTKVRCPFCVGCGLVPPDVAVLAEQALAMMKDNE